MIWCNILVGFALNPSKPLFVYYSYWFLNADFDSHWRSTIKAMRRTTIIKTFTQPLLEQWCFINSFHSFPRMNNPGFFGSYKSPTGISWKYLAWQELYTQKIGLWNSIMVWWFDSGRVLMRSSSSWILKCD